MPTVAQAGAFRLVPRDGSSAEELLNLDVYSAAMGFVRGAFDVEGSLVDAVRWFLSRDAKGAKDRALRLLAHFGPWKYLSQSQRENEVASRVRFHYDVSNDFYRVFLGRDLVYSCAYFEGAEMPLEEAQQAKLAHICRKLDIRAGDRLLDIGCGWGALLLKAGGTYGAVATGCTLSRNQATEARKRVAEAGLEGRVCVLETDYRQVRGTFEKIASIGMFEHVGRRGLQAYFRKAHELLAPGGLFLNHGIVRPQGEQDDAATLFIQRHVFPVGGITRLSDVFREAEDAGFEVLDMENLRAHYARTCEEWVRRLQSNREECLKHVPPEVWRTWVLYLAGSAVNFRRGALEVQQLLMAKRGEGDPSHWTRHYMYA